MVKRCIPEGFLCKITVLMILDWYLLIFQYCIEISLYRFSVLGRSVVCNDLTDRDQSNLVSKKLCEGERISGISYGCKGGRNIKMPLRKKLAKCSR